MFDRTPKNADCRYSEQLVAYFYHESENDEQEKFAAHLKTCVACSEELASFSAVRSAFKDWKTEFAKLETPPIEIPYEVQTEEKTAAVMEKSWLKNLREIFSGVPMWKMTVASLAALVVCFGLVFFVLNGETNQDIAGSNQNSLEPSVSPQIEAVVNQIDQPHAEKTIPNETIPTKQKIQNLNFVKTDYKTPNKRNGATYLPPHRNNARKRESPKNMEELPELMPYAEDEDNTLRLTDLFSEIDTKD